MRRFSVFNILILTLSSGRYSVAAEGDTSGPERAARLRNISKSVWHFIHLDSLVFLYKSQLPGHVLS
jgi:hypothetical protein